MRVATIDIGTNTVLLLVAERAASGALRAVIERATITRLGEGVDRTHRLAPAAVQRTRECLEDYARLARGAGVARVAVVGTSAMRDAAGGDEVRAAVRDLFGVEASVLTGVEEARLAFLGASNGLDIDVGRSTSAFDVGGGSTEVVIGHLEDGAARIEYAQSFDVGSVRLTERHGEDRQALAHAAAVAFSNVPPLPDRSALPIGIAGTVTTLAAVSLALVPYDGARVHGHAMRTTDVAAVVDRLAKLDLEARRKVAGIEPKRADVIVAGGVLVLALLEHWGCSEMVVSDRGVRWGLAAEIAC